MKKNKLTNEDRIILKKAHKKERDGRIRDRMKAVLLYDAGWSYIKIAEALLIDEETVSKQINEYFNDNKLKPENGGSKSNLNDIQTKELLEHLESKTYTKTKDICAYIYEKFGILYTISGMTKWLHNNGFSYKKPIGIPAKANHEAQSKFIEFYKELKENTTENEPIEFGDGVHPTMATKITYGWIRKGKKIFLPTTASRTRVNLMGSINLNTMDVTIAEYKTIDSSALENHFKLLKDKYPNASTIHLILDQGPYNKSKETLKAAKFYNITIHFLPTYSPNLNPIERLWKIMNEHTRNNVFFDSAKVFKEKIHNFFTKTWLKISHSMTNRINDTFDIIKSTSSG